MRFRLFRLLAVSGGLFLWIGVEIASAAIIVDPSTVTGSNAIDPVAGVAGWVPSDQEIDDTDRAATGTTYRPGNVSETTLEARSDLRVLREWPAFDSFGADPVNIVSFSDDARPDLRFTLSGDDVNSTSGTVNDDPVRSTSAGSSYLLFGLGSGSTWNLNVDFGEYADSTFQLTKRVDAVGFTVGQIVGGTTYTVQFQSFDGSTYSTLSTQSIVGSNSDGNAGDAGAPDGFFSYDADGSFENSISRVVISRNVASSQGRLDDFAFSSAITAVPEPGSMALIGFGTLTLLWLRRSLRAG